MSDLGQAVPSTQRAWTAAVAALMATKATTALWRPVRYDTI